MSPEGSGVGGKGGSGQAAAADSPALPTTQGTSTARERRGTAHPLALRSQHPVRAGAPPAPHLPQDHRDDVRCAAGAGVRAPARGANGRPVGARRPAVLPALCRTSSRPSTSRKCAGTMCGTGQVCPSGGTRGQVGAHTVPAQHLPQMRWDYVRLWAGVSSPHIVPALFREVLGAVPLRDSAGARGRAIWLKGSMQGSRQAGGGGHGRAFDLERPPTTTLA
jgi:hypothetical protein